MSGVTTWSVDMVREIRRRGRSGILVKHTCYPGYRELTFPEPDELDIVFCPGETPFCIRNADVLPQYADVYRHLMPGIIIPNWSPSLYAVCAALARDDPESLRTIGYAHSDEPFYYDTLQFYEPIVHKFVAVSQEVYVKLAQRLSHRVDDIVLRPYSIRESRKLTRAYTPTNLPIQIVYAGRIASKQKRILDLVTLVQWLVQYNVHFRLSIYGDGPDEEQLRRSLSSGNAQVKDLVSFCGMVTPSELQAVWRTSDVCMLVSDFEGMSLSMLEAMSNGCVPVVTQVSGTLSTIKEGYNGFLVQVGDMENMARKIQILESQRDRLAAMGRNAMATIAAEHNCDSYMAWFLAMCEDVWHQPGRYWPKGISIHSTTDVEV